jgi:hypothetical protein
MCLAKEEPHKWGAISLSIVQVERQGVSGFNKLGGAFKKLGQRFTPATSTEIRQHECLARGWDVSNEQWRSVLWPALDKDFRAAVYERTPRVWNIQCIAGAGVYNERRSIESVKQPAQPSVDHPPSQPMYENGRPFLLHISRQ